MRLVGGARSVTESAGVTRALLIETGPLHSDGSLDLDPAACLGWDVPEEVSAPAKPVEAAPVAPSPRPALFEERV